MITKVEIQPPASEPLVAGAVVVRLFRRAHLILGVAGVVAFLATGQYMDRRWDPLHGIYWTRGRTGSRLAARAVGSVMVAAGPFLFVLAFLREPWLHDLARPFARWGIYGSFAGVLLHALAGSSRGRSS